MKNKGGKKVTPAQVMVYIPNLIGYGRFISLFVSVYFAFGSQHWHLFLTFYALSQFLDAFDGMAARKFD